MSASERWPPGVYTRRDGRHVPFCQACRWWGTPRRLASEARGAVRRHEASTRHRAARP